MYRFISRIRPPETATAGGGGSWLAAAGTPDLGDDLAATTTNPGVYAADLYALRFPAGRYFDLPWRVGSGSDTQIDACSSACCRQA